MKDLAQNILFGIFFGSERREREVNESIKKKIVNLKAKAASLTVFLIAVLFLAALSGTQFIGEVSAIDYDEYTGTLGDADWALRIPDPWNGMLVMVCRGGSPTLPDPSSTLTNFGSSMLNQGFAVAASNYGATGWPVSEGVKSTYQLTNYIIENETYGVTGRVFLYGFSLGGGVALLLGEKYPDIYSGVLDAWGIKDMKHLYTHAATWGNMTDEELTTELTELGCPVPPPGYTTLQDFRDGLVFLVGLYETVCGGTPEANPAGYEALSPTYHANIKIPVITVHGTADPFVPYFQSLLYQTAVADAGRSSLYRLYNVTGGLHGSTDVMAEIPARFDDLVNWTNRLWINMTYGGTEYDYGHGETVQTSDGGYALSGTTNSSGTGGLDFWLIKTDAIGNMEWNKTYGWPIDEVCDDMCQTSDGGYALLGQTNSSGAGNADFWLVKTDADGNMQWNKTYGGSSDEIGYSVIQTDDDGYALAGNTKSFGAGDWDFWLVKTDTNGNMEWNMTYGGAEVETDASVVQTGDGGYAFAGCTKSFGAGGFDFWLGKMDANGSLQWSKTYGDSGDDRGWFLVQTNDGGYLMTGYTTSFSSLPRAYLVKTDATGNMQWNNTYGEFYEIGTHGIQTMDGGYAITGYSYVSPTNGYFLLIKTDENGDSQWKKTYGGPDAEEGWSIIQTSDKGYALTGGTDSFGVGGKDFWFIKVDEFGVIPESFTITIVVLLSTISVAVSFWLLRKRPKLKTSLLEKP